MFSFHWIICFMCLQGDRGEDSTVTGAPVSQFLVSLLTCRSLRLIKSVMLNLLLPGT